MSYGQLFFLSLTLLLFLSTFLSSFQIFTFTLVLCVAGVQHGHDLNVTLVTTPGECSLRLPSMEGGVCRRASVYTTAGQQRFSSCVNGALPVSQFKRRWWVNLFIIILVIETEARLFHQSHWSIRAALTPSFHWCCQRVPCDSNWESMLLVVSRHVC